MKFKDFLKKFRQPKDQKGLEKVLRSAMTRNKRSGLDLIKKKLDMPDREAKALMEVMRNEAEKIAKKYKMRVSDRKVDGDNNFSGLIFHVTSHNEMHEQKFLNEVIANTIRKLK